METKYKCLECGEIAVSQRIDCVGHSQAFCTVCGYEAEWTDFTWPDLLAACKKVKEHFAINSKTYYTLKRAIVKAEGK